MMIRLILNKYFNHSEHWRRSSLIFDLLDDRLRRARGFGYMSYEYTLFRSHYKLHILRTYIGL